MPPGKVYFIHCNFCGKCPKQGMQFYASSCSHVTCGLCRKKKESYSICRFCNTQVVMEELGPDMVNKEYFEDPCYIVQSVIKSIQARLDEYGDDESQKNISALASTTTLTNTSALTNDTTHSHNPDTTTDTFEDSIANSSYDNEFYMDGVAHNVETLTNEANQAITSIRSFANQLEDVMEKSQQPHSLDLRWACTPTKKFK